MPSAQARDKTKSLSAIPFPAKNRLALKELNIGVLVMNASDRGAAPLFYAVDFFCGAGGTSRGVIDAGGHVLAGLDKVGEYKDTFELNNVNLDGSRARFLHLDILPRGPANPAGQKDEAFAALHALVDPIRADGDTTPLLFVVCAPCQPFTSVNRGKLSDELAAIRSEDKNLLYHSLAYIREFRPDAVLCENVAGIQNRKFGGVWDNFSAALADLGYHSASQIVDTSDFGIAQVRKRSILLAVRTDRANGITVPDSDPNATRISVRQAIGHLPRLGAGAIDGNDPEHRSSKVSDLNRQRLEAATEGGSNMEFDDHLALPCHKRLRARMAGKPGGYSDSYSRLSGDKPAPTITTKFYSFSNGRFGHFDRSQNRALSVREAACLQSFPEDFRFMTPSITSAAKMIGNAVPPKLCEFFTRHLSSVIST
jgi:DNA (cytosine-5)-methyltransferase 1